MEHCYVCFEPLTDSTKLFGFTEFLSGLALLVLAWTNADVRYRFRIRTAPLPLQELTFATIVLLGGMTLLTDVWRAEHWPVITGHFITPVLWQGLMAATFLTAFCTWIWYAFIGPPVFRPMNADRFVNTLYYYILKGSPDELAIVAGELIKSLPSIISFAPSILRHTSEESLLPVEDSASEILLLMADKRFCRAVVKSSPGTALKLFSEMDAQQKLGINVRTFSKNILNEAILDKDSFIYHEAEGYETGFMGYVKPLTQTMYGNFDLVETVNTLLVADYKDQSKWDSEQWEAYCRVVLITFDDYMNSRLGRHCSTINRAMSSIIGGVYDMGSLDGSSDNAYNSPTFLRLQVVVSFFVQAIEILERHDVPDHMNRVNNETHADIYGQIAEKVFDIIMHCSRVRTPSGLAWTVHYSSVWFRFFGIASPNSNGALLIRAKVLRLLAKEICEMKETPHYGNTSILGFCLNVLGFKPRTTDDLQVKAFQRFILSWARKNFASLYEANPVLVEHCLPGFISYDRDNCKLIKSYIETLGRPPNQDFMDVIPAALQHNPPREHL